MLEIFITVGILIIAAIPPIWYILKYRRGQKRSQEQWEESVETGRTEPVSLHPYIDPNICIGTGACVSACPEGKILGIIDGRGKLVEPSNCIGHGECYRACPVGAITLVFGTERRGVDIPHVRENFETNIEGIHIVGELGGMGLIRNAVTQGRECIEYIAPELKKRSSKDGMYDVAVVGAGPAGLSATAKAIEMGLSYVTLEQNDIGGAILTYPRQKIVMTQPMEIPIYGKSKFREILKEDLLDLWKEVIEKTGMEVHTKQKVEDIRKTNGHFTITTQQGHYEARKVILAIGRRGTPRKLEVPGELSSKVTYQLIEPEQYIGKKCLVVGGGDSAVEAAISLSETLGKEVNVSYRKDAFARIKKKNVERIHAKIETGEVKVLWKSNVTAIHPDHIELEQESKKLTIPNDFVLVFIGGVVPTGFLNKIGIQVETKFGEER